MKQDLRRKMGQAWASQFECKTSIEGHAHKSGLRELRIVRIPLVYVYIYSTSMKSCTPKCYFNKSVFFWPIPPHRVHLLFIPEVPAYATWLVPFAVNANKQRSIWQWAPSVCQKRSQSAIKCSLALRQHSNIASPQVHKHRQHSHLRSPTHVSRNGSKKRTVPASIASRVKRRKAQE